MEIRPANESDFPTMFEIFQAVIAKGDTYAFSPTTSSEVAHRYILGDHITTRVAVDPTTGQVVGFYKLIANQPDLGSHVANASFMVSPAAHGRGVGRQLCVHCLKEAKRQGFMSMQYNIVVSTNENAVHLWKSLGFSIVGTLPRAFNHMTLGYVDAYVMFRFLDDIEVE